MKKWFTLYFVNGTRIYELYPVDESLCPLIPQQVLNSVDVIVPGFDFTYVYDEGAQEWSFTKDKVELVHLYQTSPPKVCVEHMRQLLRLYDQGKFGLQDLQVKNIEHLTRAIIPVKNVERFWNRVYEGELH